MDGIRWYDETVAGAVFGFHTIEGESESSASHERGLDMRVAVKLAFRPAFESERNNHQIWMIRENLALNARVGIYDGKCAHVFHPLQLFDLSPDVQLSATGPLFRELLNSA